MYRALTNKYKFNSIIAKVESEFYEKQSCMRSNTDHVTLKYTHFHIGLCIKVRWALKWVWLSAALFPHPAVGSE